MRVGVQRMDSARYQDAGGGAKPCFGDNGPQVTGPGDSAGAGGLRHRIDWPAAILWGSLVCAGYYLSRYVAANRQLIRANRQALAQLEAQEPRGGDLIFPPLRAQTVDGGAVDLLDGSGESLWVIFSVHCAACRSEFPKWLGVSKEIAASHIGTHFISLDTRQEISDYPRNGSTLKLEIAPAGFQRSLRLMQIPFYMLVSQDGKIAWVHRGALSSADIASLHSAIASLQPVENLPARHMPGCEHDRGLSPCDVGVK